MKAMNTISPLHMLSKGACCTLNGGWLKKLSRKDPVHKVLCIDRDGQEHHINGNTLVEHRVAEPTQIPAESKRAKLQVERHKRRKARKERQMNLRAQAPRLLRRISRRDWASFIAQGILNGSLKKCCNTGCLNCGFIGWKGRLPLSHEHVNYYSTTEYADIMCVSYRTIQRKCNSGEIRCFKLNGKRYIL